MQSNCMHPLGDYNPLVTVPIAARLDIGPILANSLVFRLGYRPIVFVLLDALILVILKYCPFKSLRAADLRWCAFYNLLTYTI